MFILLNIEHFRKLAAVRFDARAVCFSSIECSRSGRDDSDHVDHIVLIPVGTMST